LVLNDEVPELSVYSELQRTVWGSNQEAPPKGLWLEKSGRGGK
jgi:hypothetical protein